MKVEIEIDETKIKELIIAYIDSQLPETVVKPEDVKLLVRSTRNYKCKEWEDANLMVTNKPMPDLTPPHQHTQIKASVRGRGTK